VVADDRSTRQAEKGSAFRALHAGEAFVMPNPWDAGSARVLAAHGFKALATTSSGFAFTLGRLDGEATLDEVVAHAAALDRATELPLSVDLENGYGPDPEDAALAITRVAEAGAVGGSIEDYDPGGHIYPLHLAVQRILAAAEAARALGFPFMLTARAENHIRGNPISRTRSRASRLSTRPAPTSCTRPASEPPTRSKPSAMPSTSRSTCWRFLGCRSTRSWLQGHAG
jgi:2-methylisocitrate lyase-like PEP mutase family enzyme